MKIGPSHTCRLFSHVSWMPESYPNCIPRFNRTRRRVLTAGMTARVCEEDVFQLANGEFTNIERNFKPCAKCRHSLNCMSLIAAHTWDISLACSGGKLVSVGNSSSEDNDTMSPKSCMDAGYSWKKVCLYGKQYLCMRITSCLIIKPNV